MKYQNMRSKFHKILAGVFFAMLIIKVWPKIRKLITKK